LFNWLDDSAYFSDQMVMPAPLEPKIYHIVHVDRLPSIIAAGGLLSDAKVLELAKPGTTIGMGNIKERRLKELQLKSHPGLFVGQCVPFYFCPRSIMLYLLYRGSHPELTYRDGQGPIVHLMGDLLAAVEFARSVKQRWAFTLSNAGAYYFEDRCELAKLDEVNWEAVAANQWSGNGVSASVKEGKQAEFLVEDFFPWRLIERIGVHSKVIGQRVIEAMKGDKHRPPVEILTDWYY
jgi:hypothetical protein